VADNRAARAREERVPARLCGCGNSLPEDLRVIDFDSTRLLVRIWSGTAGTIEAEVQEGKAGSEMSPTRERHTSSFLIICSCS